LNNPHPYELPDGMFGGVASRHAAHRPSTLPQRIVPHRPRSQIVLLCSALLHRRTP
jgi:hypothetical protein